MRASARRGSATVDYIGAVVAVGLLLLALLAVREHRPERRPPLNPVATIGALLRPPAPVVRLRPHEPRPPTRPRRRRPRPPAPPRETVLAPFWAFGW